jgi:predicted dehydrogenase
MTAEIGVAFIGTGMVSDLHQAALAGAGGLRLVGAYDTDRGALMARAERWRVRPYGSVEELLDDAAVDAAYVLTPADSHVPLALRCLAAGRHVLVEKPVAYEPEEIAELARAARASGRVVMPGHNYAYLPEFQRIVRLATEGALGTLRAVWVTYILKHPEEIAASYGGVLEEVMIHHSYLALTLMGTPARVHAGIHPGAWTSHRAEDQAWMVWQYPDGSSAFLFATFAADDQSADPWTFVVKVVGTEGSASMSWRGAVGRNDRTPWFAFGIPVYEETYSHESRAFQQAVAAGVPPISSLEDAATSARIIRRAYEAAGSGGTVDLGQDGEW